MAAKSNNNIFLLALLAAGGYYWYTQQQKNKAAAGIAPTNINPVTDTPAGSAGTFINVDGAVSNVDTANNEFNQLLIDGYINPGAGNLPLTAFEKDVLYRDIHSGLFQPSQKQDDAANAVWEKYPGLKI